MHYTSIKTKVRAHRGPLDLEGLRLADDLEALADLAVGGIKLGMVRAAVIDIDVGIHTIAPV
jgi:hypothetical protein